MRVSWDWLSDFVDLQEVTPAELAERLTMAGLEVEGIDRLGAHLDQVVLGTVLTCTPHPNADSLNVCTVDAGQDEALTIVCGAPNVRAGMRAPVALIGAVLPGDFVIKKSKIRGEASFGMLCSAAELGIDADASGLLVLDHVELPNGTPIGQALGIEDSVLDISLTPNRADALSIRGIAREVTVLYGGELREPALPVEPVEVKQAGETTEVVQVRVEDADACPRYACVVLKGLQVAPSPEWLRRRVEAVGLRSINNLVDVTNYVLFETGQPLHAFDLRILKGNEIVVRHATAGERLTTIDHVERTLITDDVVIADASGPVALAGVMGGVGTEVSDDTTDILIECANFSPSSVRRSARRLGIHTDSSHRFERGVDVELIPWVLERTVALIAATQQGLVPSVERVGGMIDVVSKPFVPVEIRLPLEMPGQILGAEIPALMTAGILRSLGLGVAKAREGGALIVSIPGFRPDLERPIDLVEEVCRVIGYDALQELPLHGELGLLHEERRGAAPRAQDYQPILPQTTLDRLDRICDSLVDRGFYEAVTWPLSDPARNDLFSTLEGAIRLKNPLGEERSLMRKSLMPGLLDSLRNNLTRGTDDVALFEIGRIYPANLESPANEAPEPEHLALVWTGTVDPHWSSSPRAVDGSDLVGALTAVATAAGVELRVEAPEGEPAPWLHPGEAARLLVGKELVGWVGRLHPRVLDVWEIGRTVVAAELSLDALLAVDPPMPKFRHFGRTPASGRDMALIVDQSVPFASLREAMDSFSSPLLESWSTFDVFEGGSLEAGTRSIALRVVWRDKAGTLTDQQVDKVHDKLLRHLEHRVGARLRS